MYKSEMYAEYNGYCYNDEVDQKQHDISVDSHGQKTRSYPTYLVSSSRWVGHHNWPLRYLLTYLLNQPSLHERFVLYPTRARSEHGRDVYPSWC